MTRLRNLAINLEVGQEILVGKNNEVAKITKIEYFDKSGDISVNTTKGPRKVLTFRLCDDSHHYDNPADKYR
jgi:hypothetical protein